MAPVLQGANPFQLALSIIFAQGQRFVVIREAMSETLVDRIARHKGFSSHVYQDAKGFLSIGYGTTVGRVKSDSLHALVFHKEGVGITKVQARGLLKDRVNEIQFSLGNPQIEVAGTLHRMQCQTTDDASILRAQIRFEVLVEMAYQLGVSGLLNFKRMWAALAKQDYETAAAEMLDSRWAQQTPDRAKELAEIMRSKDT